MWWLRETGPERHPANGVQIKKGKTMFKGEEYVTFETAEPTEKLFEKVEGSLAELGKISITKKGTITIEPRSKLSNAFSQTSMEGQLAQKKGAKQHTLTVNYDVSPTIICWLVIVVGTLTLFLGWLAIFLPMSHKKAVGKEVQKALAQIEDDLTA